MVAKVVRGEWIVDDDIKGVTLALATGVGRGEARVDILNDLEWLEGKK